MGELLLRDCEGEPMLPSHALGVCAVDMLSHITGRVSPEVWYERGAYHACAEHLVTSHSIQHNPLSIAAHMLSLAFSDTADSLYFSADVDWRRIEELALMGAESCTDYAAVEEFVSGHE